MGIFDWIGSLFKKKPQGPERVHVYINHTSAPVVFIPYSGSDPSNVRLQPNTAKVVSFPGFVSQDFECQPDNIKRMLTDATAIHICNHPDEQYYYDVDSKTLYFRRKGGGDLSTVSDSDTSVEQQVLKLTKAY